MAATKKKSAATKKQSGAKKSGKTAAKKQSGKKPVKKSAAKKQPERKMVKRTVKRANGKTVKIDRPAESHQFGHGGTVRSEPHGGAAEVASALVCTDADGRPNNRARVGSEQIADIAYALKTGKTKQSATAVLHGLIGGKSAKQSVTIARQYADGQIGRTELPDGAGERIGKSAERKTRDGKTLRFRKLSGKSLVGGLVGLVESPPSA